MTRDIVVKNRRGESYFFHFLDHQLLLWMQNRNILPQRLHRIFLNKFIYFCAKEMDLKVGGSWYLFGPHVWRGPLEAQNSFVSIVELARQKGIELKLKFPECEEAQKILDYLGGIYFQDGYTPPTTFKFLNALYSQKQEFDFLKTFYLQKNRMEEQYYAFNNNKTDSIELAKEVKRYEHEMLLKKYAESVNLSMGERLLLVDFYVGLITNLEENKNRDLQIRAFEFQETTINRFVCGKNSVKTAESFSSEDKLKYITKEKNKFIDFKEAIAQKTSDFDTALYLHGA